MVWSSSTTVSKPRTIHLSWRIRSTGNWNQIPWDNQRWKLWQSYRDCTRRVSWNAARRFRKNVIYNKTKDYFFDFIRPFKQTKVNQPCVVPICTKSYKIAGFRMNRDFIAFTFLSVWLRVSMWFFQQEINMKVLF